MHPSLTRCLTMVHEATRGLDDRQAAVRVDGRWSIAEIVEHLDRTYTGTTKGFERCLESGTPRVSKATLATRTRKVVVVNLGFFPTGIEAPKHVVPSGQVPLSDVLARIGHSLETLDAVAARAAARWTNAPVLDHPILGPFSIGDWLRFHQVHTRHHQKQVIARRQGVSAAE